MARSLMLPVLAFAAYAFAVPDNRLEARQNACGARGQSFSACLGTLGPAFCTSFLAPTTLASSTSTSTVINYLATTTSTASALTSTVPGSTTVSSTITSTVNATSITGTDTSFIATSTTDFTTTSTIYTCPSPSVSALGPASSASSVTPALSPATSSSSSGSVSIMSTLARRAGSTLASVTPPACFATYTARNPGAAAISTPCRNCFGVPFPSPATVTIPSTTITSTINAVLLTVTTPTVTSTSYSTALQTASTTITTTINAATTLNATRTVTNSFTTFVTTSSATPTNFGILYTNDTDGSTVYGRAANVTGGTGTFITFGGKRDTFNIDTLGRLDDTAEPEEFLASNPQDRFDYVFLVNTATPADTPSCAGCNGTLLCNYPGDTDDVWAICDDVLALGPPGSFADTECGVIDLLYEETPVAS